MVANIFLIKYFLIKNLVKFKSLKTFVGQNWLHPLEAIETNMGKKLAARPAVRLILEHVITAGVRKMKCGVKCNVRPAVGTKKIFGEYFLSLFLSFSLSLFLSLYIFLLN
jgi:hypothetical protein